MIYTVTFNPSLDYTIHVENFELGKVKPHGAGRYLCRRKRN